MIARSAGGPMDSRPAYSPTRVGRLRALHDWILVSEMQFTERITQSGLVLPNDNGTGSGIRPRWGQVYAVGPRQNLVRPGQWICVAHGRWTRGIDIEDDSGTKTLRRVDPKDILLASDHEPQDDTMSDAINVTAKTR
jgi:co-chaperonin GroES (HSP10)